MGNALVYDVTEHPALFMSPCEAYEQGMELAGARSHRVIAYSEAFLMQTRPTTRTGKESERELQRLLGKPSTIPISSLPHLSSSINAQARPLPVQLSRTSSRIERASYRDLVDEQVVTTPSTKCTYLGIIEVTCLEFQEAGTTCVVLSTWEHG